MRRIINEYKGLRKELYVLFIGKMMTSMGSMIWPMFTLILSNKLNMSAAEIAFYMMIFGIAGLPIGLLGGKLADKYNKRNIIIICDFVSVFGYLYCGFVPLTFKSIIVFALSSLFQSIEYPSYEALVADFTTPSDRERAYSLSYLGNNLGLVLSPTIAGILLNDHLNIAFYISGFSILLSTILIFLFVRNVEREENKEDVNVYEKDLEDDVSTLSFLLHNRVLMIFMFSTCLYFFVYQQYGYLMPLELSKVFGENGSIIYGSVSSVNCIVVVVFTSLITTYFKKYKEIDKQMFGSLLQLFGYFIFVVLMRQIWAAYLAIVVFTLGEIFSTLATPPFMSKRIPANHRGRVNSILSVTEQLIISIGQLVTGKIYDANSAMAWVFVFVVGFIAAGLLLVTKVFDKKDYKELY